jgi:hypothetical protein
MTKIDVLWFEGCPNGPATHKLVERIARELNLDAVISLIDVTSPEMAQELRFLGSPSVQVNGLDIEPERRDDLNYALACRVYRSTQGTSGTLPENMVRSALEEAVKADQG